MEVLAATAKSLAFDPKIFLLQVGLFILLVVVMNAVFLKPVLAHLKLRDKEITDAYSQRDRLQNEMEQLRADYLARLAVVEAEARGHIQTAIKEAQSERERLLAEARESSDAALKTGIANLEREMSEALQSMRGSMVGLAADAAGKALGSAVESAQLRSTVDERLKLDAA
jgi:F-type H+-transporting ATPase subunit b